MRPYLLSLLLLPLLVACDGHPVDGQPGAGPADEAIPGDGTPADATLGVSPDAITYVYRCDDAYAFTAHVGGETSWLFLPGVTVQLQRVISASGVKYADEDTVFWSKADEALLDHDGRTHRHCRNDRRAAIWEHARLNGADFRAVGNEPGWHLEISRRDHIVLVSDYGQSRYEFDGASITSSSEDRRSSYRADNGTSKITVVLVGETCHDTMADEVYETRVEVRLDDIRLLGCGRALH